MFVAISLSLTAMLVVTSLANGQSTLVRAATQQVTSSTTPKRDRLRPHTFTTTGTVGYNLAAASLVALTDSDVWTVASEAFIGFLMAESTAARAVIRALARQSQEQQAFVDDLLFLDLKGRVAKRLLQMATPDLDLLPADGTVVPEVTQADLASLCGGSRENVTRILKEFERRELVHRDGHRYVLKKVGSLAKIADL